LDQVRLLYSPRSDQSGSGPRDDAGQRQSQRGPGQHQRAEQEPLERPAPFGGRERHRRGEGEREQEEGGEEGGHFSSASASSISRAARRAAASKSIRGAKPSRAATSSELSEVPGENNCPRRNLLTAGFAYQSSPNLRRMPSCIMPASTNARA